MGIEETAEALEKIPWILWYVISILLTMCVLSLGALISLVIYKWKQLNEVIDTLSSKLSEINTLVSLNKTAITQIAGLEIRIRALEMSMAMVKGVLVSKKIMSRFTDSEDSTNVP